MTDFHRSNVTAHCSTCTPSTASPTEDFHHGISVSCQLKLIVDPIGFLEIRKFFILTVCLCKFKSLDLT